MQLHAARLCLDCQEVHAETTCPLCSSSSFAPLSRWVPPQERRIEPRSVDGSDRAEAYRRLLESNEQPRKRARWPAPLGLLAAAGVAAWVWRRSPGRPGREQAEEQRFRARRVRNVLCGA